MSETLNSVAAAALEELLEVAPHVDVATITNRYSRDLIASAPATAASTIEHFAKVTGQLLEAAEQARTELGREPIVQVEVASRDGHLFLVADDEHVVTAVTAPDPTVGLVFYDLKTALRAVRDHVDKSAFISTSSTSSSDEASSDPIVVPVTTTINESDEPQRVGRWRRRKS